MISEAVWWIRQMIAFIIILAALRVSMILLGEPDFPAGDEQQSAPPDEGIFQWEGMEAL